MDIKKVGVVGCGIMGSGIAQVCARSGYQTVVSEINDELLNKGLGALRGSLAKSVEKGKLAKDEEQATLGRLKGTTEIKDFAECDLVIEAIVENMAEKRELFAALDKLCLPNTILASNTSALSIIEMAGATKRTDRVVGLHFFNPVPVMRLLEVVQTIATSEETLNTAKSFGQSLGKTLILAKDTPGFIVNRILVPSLLEAIRAFESGMASKEDIDNGMVLGCNWPMGPLALLDLLGLDVCVHMMNVLYDEFKDPRWAVPPLLKQMVLAGHYGRKSGKGFYDYK